MQGTDFPLPVDFPINLVFGSLEVLGSPSNEVAIIVDPLACLHLLSITEYQPHALPFRFAGDGLLSANRIPNPLPHGGSLDHQAKDPADGGLLAPCI